MKKKAYIVKKGISLILACSVIISSSFLASSSVTAKNKTKAMVIDNLYYGSAAANIEASAAGASTSFGSPSVYTSVSADLLYNKADGTRGTISGNDSGYQTSSVSLSHSNTYSVTSSHYASVNGGSSSKTIRIVR